MAMLYDYVRQGVGRRVVGEVTGAAAVGRVVLLVGQGAAEVAAYRVRDHVVVVDLVQRVLAVEVVWQRAAEFVSAGYRERCE